MLKQLMEKRDKAAKAYRDLVLSMQNAGQAPDADERAKMDAMVAEIDGLDAQIRDEQAKIVDQVQQMEEALKNLRIDERGGSSDPDPQKEERVDLLRFLRTGEGVEEQRAMTTTTGSTGGYLVPEKFYKELKEYHGDLCPIYKLASKSEWDADAVFPVVTAFGATTLVTEGSAKTGVTPTIGQKNLTGYQAIYLVDVPEPLLRKSAYNIDTKMSQWWAKSDAACLEDYFAEGTGSSQPTGLAAGASAGTDTASNSEIVGDDVVNWYYDLKASYRKRASWIFADSTIALIRKIKNPVTTSGALQYIWLPGLGGVSDTLMGKPIHASDGFSAFTAGAAAGVFGDISEFQIVEFGKPSLIRDPYTVANYGQVRFVGYRLIDCDLPVAEAVVTCPIAS